jgi:DNA methyltransferase 1-associated protein 1
VEEEEMLKSELRRIEARKKEREKKTQDLQKLIAQADSSGAKIEKKGGGGSHKKKTPSSSNSAGRSPGKEVGSIDPSAGIKFPDVKAAGVTLRSQRMKLPPSVGQKKAKAIEQMLQEISVEPMPMPTEEICSEFNDLRSDMVLLYELKNALATCDIELQSLRAQYEALCPGKSLEIPDKLKPPSVASILRGEKTKNISDVIDVVGNSLTPPVRKRKAALEQSNVLKKIKNKNF